MSRNIRNTILYDRLALAVATGSLILGCNTLEPDSSLPQGAQLIEAPGVYEIWWARTEACADLRGRFESVAWYIVPGVRTFETDTGEKVGYWLKSNHGTSIILAGNYRDHELVVRHEILHELLGREGHPDDYFRGRCSLTWDTFGSDLAVR